MRSERLFLRPAWPEDWSEIFAQISDEAVVRNLSRVPWPYTQEAAQHFAALRQDGNHPHFLITLPDAQGVRLVGCIGLTPGYDAAELDCWIGREHWGRGFATEAVRAMLSLSRAIGHRQLSAAHFIDNPASGRVLRKAGFCPTGRVEERYSLARGQVAPAAILKIALGEPCDCDDDLPVRRAA
ncbi:GNAT family N-acetyltransferase [Novosphingobium sp. TH158]|uniref:GNAT family N-acetyltransferase n=1 Tax=Novosphingobium sp. TH158 TaxID=2067455 RepID=UPI0020B1327E|nr:GNAT family N-acetyltransferase [Novosphingobium sp. TH158]